MITTNEDIFLNPHSYVNMVCDCMNSEDILLSLVLECPYDAKRKLCPITELVKWREMTLKDVRNAINNLSQDAKKQLVEKHRSCSCSLTNKDHEHFTN